MSNKLNSGWTYYDRIQKEHEGQTVLEFYTAMYAHSTREEWRERIREKAVLLDGRLTTLERTIGAGQRLEYRRASWLEPTAPLAFAVLYRDHHLLAVAKPSGLPVLPGGNFLENTLLARVRLRFPGRLEFAPIHRIGRATSGIVLFARSDLAKRALSEDFRDGRITKYYRALAQGTEMADQFVVDTPIGLVPYPGLNLLHAATEDGKPSRSECEVLRRKENGTALIRVRLITGRAHQIRIHLASAGHPLVGDPLYQKGGNPLRSAGENVPMPGDCGYHLHAHEIAFTHPESGEDIRLFCHPPPLLRTPAE